MGPPQDEAMEIEDASSTAETSGKRPDPAVNGKNLSEDTSMEVEPAAVNKNGEDSTMQTDDTTTATDKPNEASKLPDAPASAVTIDLTADSPPSTNNEATSVPAATRQDASDVPHPDVAGDASKSKDVELITSDKGDGDDSMEDLFGPGTGGHNSNATNTPGAAALPDSNVAQIDSGTAKSAGEANGQAGAADSTVLPANALGISNLPPNASAEVAAAAAQSDAPVSFDASSTAGLPPLDTSTFSSSLGGSGSGDGTASLPLDLSSLGQFSTGPATTNDQPASTGIEVPQIDFSSFSATDFNALLAGLTQSTGNGSGGEGGDLLAGLNLGECVLMRACPESSVLRLVVYESLRRVALANGRPIRPSR